MSSLGISLLLLLAVAIALAIGYNLRQGAWPRWEQGLRRFAGDLRARGRSLRADASRRKDAAAPTNGRRGAERGEPRLGGDAAGPTTTAADNEAFDAPAAEAELPAADLDPVRFARDEVGLASSSAQEEQSFAAGPTGTTAEAREAAEAKASAGALAAARSVQAEALARAPAAPSDAPVSSIDAAAGPLASAASATAAASAAPVASAPPAAHEPAPGNAGEPGVAAPMAAPAAASARIPAAASGPALSEASDCVVEIALPTPLAGERLLAIAQRFRRSGSKPVAFDGRPKAAVEFEPPVAGRSYEVIRVGILLANRHGPLNAMEFSEFVSAVQAMAETLSARAEMPAMGSVLARARDLDSTCAQLDVQIGVNVETPEAVDPAQLASLAQSLGLVERGSHRYVRQGPQGEPLFSLGFSDSPSRLTFLLDVPRVAASLEPFGRMVQAAGACAQRLGARLVDDSGKPLTQAALTQIARQLDQRYESLEAIGLPAGTTLACKVFN